MWKNRKLLCFMEYFTNTHNYKHTNNCVTAQLVSNAKGNHYKFEKKNEHLTNKAKPEITNNLWYECLGLNKIVCSLLWSYE